MKKLSLIVAMACLFMVACTNNSNKGQQQEPAQTEQTCDQQKQCPFAAIEASFADWDNMTDEAKAEAVKAAKATIDEMEACHHKGCKGEMKSCCDKCVEGCCKDGKCICENCPCECMKDGKCAKEEGKPCCKAEGDKPCCKEGKPECKEGEQKPCCKGEMKSCCPKCVEGCCKDGKCICENCPCECMKDGKCNMEEGKPCCKPEMCEEMKAKCAEMCEKWANFDNLSIEDQKATIEGKLEMMKQCHKGPKGPECNKPCEKACDKPCDKPCDKVAE